MTTPANQLFQQALQLPITDREQLADQLYLSLHTAPNSQQEVDAAWGDEIAGRIAQVDNGDVTPIPAGQVHEEIRKLIDGERPDS